MRNLRSALLFFPSALALLLLLGPTAAAAQPSTAAPSLTASGLWDGYVNSFEMAVFPAAPITKLTLQVRTDHVYGPDNANCRFFLPGETWGGSSDWGEVTLDFWFPDAVLTQSQAIAVCSYFTHDYNGDLSPWSYYLSGLEARDHDGHVVDVSLCITDWDRDNYIDPPPVDGCREACGDADCSGGPITITDALHVLRRAIAVADWPQWRCDTDDDGSVGVDDALRVLRAAVGVKLDLLCSSQDSIYCLPVEPW